MIMVIKYEDVCVPISACPCCKKEMDCATPVDGVYTKPVKGDLSICINCAAALEFDAELKLKELTVADRMFLPLATQVELESAIRAVKMLNGL